MTVNETREKLYDSACADARATLLRAFEAIRRDDWTKARKALMRLSVHMEKVEALEELYNVEKRLDALLVKTGAQPPLVFDDEVSA